MHGRRHGGAALVWRYHCAGTSERAWRLKGRLVDRTLLSCSQFLRFVPKSRRSFVCVFAPGSLRRKPRASLIKGDGTPKRGFVVLDNDPRLAESHEKRFYFCHYTLFDIHICGTSTRVGLAMRKPLKLEMNDWSAIL